MAASKRASGFATVLFASLLVVAPASAAGNLNLQPDPPILVALIVGFVLLIFPTNALIFKPIFKALDERKARIEGARTRAKQIQRDADRVLSDYEERIREARIEADTSRKEQIEGARQEHSFLTAAARSEAEAQIEGARQILASDLVGARESMRGEAQELARSAAEQILGRSLS